LEFVLNKGVDFSIFHSNQNELSELFGPAVLFLNQWPYAVRFQEENSETAASDVLRIESKSFLFFPTKETTSKMYFVSNKTYNW